MNEINWTIVAPLLVVQLLLMLVALIACLRAERTNGPKWLWVVIIVFVSLLGPVAFFVFGRRND